MTTSQTLTLGPIVQVSLCIRDTARAEQFYGEILGLPHLSTFGDLAFFDAGGVRVYLHRKDPAEWQPGSILYFRVDDVHATQEALMERGAQFTGDSGAEIWMTFFEDGEGNTLALMARVEAGG